MTLASALLPWEGPPRSLRHRRPIYRVRTALAGALILATGLAGLSFAGGVASSPTNAAMDAAAGGNVASINASDIAPVVVDAVVIDAEVIDATVPESGVLGESAQRSIDTSVFVDPLTVGVAPQSAFNGILTFRGSPTRTFYGAGPVPADPEIAWRYPSSGGLCSSSSVGGEPRFWCGTGWTGQPAMFNLDGRMWSIFGALDGAVHFVDGETGEPLLAPFQTNDIIKGSVTVDPDGFPLVYTGSRDGNYRIVAFDGGEARELWRLEADAAGETLWNDDWDGSGLVVGGYLFVGGENSRIHIVALNRSWGADGEVTVDPQIVFSAPGWDDELLEAIGDTNVSIESSVMISGDTLYFANSGGLVQGWDLAPLRTGDDPTRVFRYWAGDDVDATLISDAAGMLYVGVEYERETARADALGQLLKLDPSRSGDDALIWSVAENQGVASGIWATPALHDGAVIFASEGGLLRAVDQDDGSDLWTIDLGFHLWQSPVVVDDVLLMGDCSGTLHAFDVADVRTPPTELWSIELDDGCIESTPAVWGGMIVVGTRSGAVYGIGDPA